MLYYLLLCSINTGRLSKDSESRLLLVSFRFQFVLTCWLSGEIVGASETVKIR